MPSIFSGLCTGEKFVKLSAMCVKLSSPPKNFACLRVPACERYDFDIVKRRAHHIMKLHIHFKGNLCGHSELSAALSSFWGHFIETFLWRLLLQCSNMFGVHCYYWILAIRYFVYKNIWCLCTLDQSKTRKITA